MFVLAGVSFAFGGWQYFQARAVQESAQQRMAFIFTTIEKSDITSYAQKQALYFSIMRGLPAAPGVLGFDISGSFAEQSAGDSCVNEGQRSVCRALKSARADAATTRAICGMCNPDK